MFNKKEYMKEWNKQYRKIHPEYFQQWRENNKEKIREYIKQWQKDKRKTDLKFNLNRKISTMIYFSLRGNKEGRKWESLTGYTLNDLIKRLKSTIPKGYTWQDFMEGKLHIDHIIPKSVFIYTKSEHVNFKECWALRNLRLLPAKENRTKHNRLEKPFQLILAF